VSSNQRSAVSLFMRNLLSCMFSSLLMAEKLNADCFRKEPS
jgi:hypothetical protein